jgi:CheY-like chemotaxis protein
MRHLKQRKRLQGIALSGFGMQEDVRKSRDAGFTEHLIKPVNVEDFQSVVKRIMAAVTQRRGRHRKSPKVRRDEPA